MKKSKKILVVGATAQLVNGFLEQAVEEGHSLALVARERDKLENLVNNLKKFSPFKSDLDKQFLIHPVNPADEHGIDEALIYFRQKWFGDIDSLLIAVGSAGIPSAKFTPGHRPSQISLSAFRESFEVNYWYALNWLFKTADWMWDLDKLMRVVIFGSISEDNLLSMVAPYTSAKSALTSMYKIFGIHAAHERRKKGLPPILFNRIVPGFFPAEQNLSLLKNADGSYTERARAIINRTPLGRMGKSEDLVAALNHLMMDCSEFMNLAEIKVDGGFDGFSGIHTGSEIPTE
ncbi:MAG: SDR family oxidoreductase [Proteobacteria bacterium]|nr:SDR family oxidoreductase [Pseudomonadota bacterium]